MGNGNEYTVDQADADYDLLTPHGEREHEGPSDECHDDDLLTPHGEREHA